MQRATLTAMLSNLLAPALIMTAISLTTPFAVADSTFESSSRKTHLLELFTSEGCSSCPPAEASLSKLKDDPRLWRDFIPLAFHVDYWDRLGWRDPFASKAWTARQYAYSALWKSSSVYTPGFVLDGREWRNSGAPPASRDEAGILKISLKRGDVVEGNFHSVKGENKPLEMHVARLRFDLNINVRAGENSGRKLLHDFVVLSLQTVEMTNEKAEVHTPKPSGNEAANSRSAIVAWITEPGQMEAVQAVGGWVP